MNYFFDNYEFTIITNEHGKPWLIAKELCDYLGIKDPGRSCTNIPDCNKQYMIFDHLKTTGKGSGRGGDNGKRLIVNEPGAYQLVFQSRKPDAWTLQQWLYNEVMPALNATGEYKMQPKIETPPKLELPLPEAYEFPEGMEIVPTNFHEALLLAAEKELQNMHLIQALKKETQEKVMAKNDLKVAERTVVRATKIVKKVEWKAKGWDEMCNLVGYYSLTAAAKIIGWSPHTFIDHLREDGYLYKKGHHGNNLAIQRYLDAGWFVVKEVTNVSNPERAFLQTMITAKGLRRFWKIYGPQQKLLT